MTATTILKDVYTNLREFVETAVILGPSARTGQVGVAFADTVSGESGSVYREGRGILQKTILWPIFPEINHDIYGYHGNTWLTMGIHG